MKYLQLGMERAFREGSLPVIMSCCVHMGNCYSCLNQLEQAKEYYSMANRMARGLGRFPDMMTISDHLLQSGHYGASAGADGGCPAASAGAPLERGNVLS